MKTKFLIVLAIMVTFMSCENQDIEFGDFGSTAVYFPYQTPVRSLILGKYDQGVNDNDNNHKFEIGVTMTGVYSNKTDRQVHFRLAPELLTGVENVMALPASYYTVETTSPVTIPKGSLKGRISIQLNDAFFEDPLAFAPLKSVNYVIPLVITDINKIDSVLVGLPLGGITNPSRYNVEDWEFLPKDYTLFGIKFMNKYQAMYLRRGNDEMTNSSNVVVNNEYRAEYVEKDEVIKLNTTGKNSVELFNRVRRGNAISPIDVNMELVFDNDGNCNIRSFGSDAYKVSGTGKFVENGDTWGGKLRDVIYLKYTYVDGLNNETHKVNDTLVVRDRDVVFEEFSVQIAP